MIPSFTRNSTSSSSRDQGNTNNCIACACARALNKMARICWNTKEDRIEAIEKVLIEKLESAKYLYREELNKQFTLFFIEHVLESKCLDKFFPKDYAQYLRVTGYTTEGNSPTSTEDNLQSILQKNRHVIFEYQSCPAIVDAIYFYGAILSPATKSNLDQDYSKLEDERKLERRKGHCVILNAMNGEFMKLMNSYGPNYGHLGEFTWNRNVLGCSEDYIEFFWYDIFFDERGPPEITAKFEGCRQADLIGLSKVSPWSFTVSMRYIGEGRFAKVWDGQVYKSFFEKCDAAIRIQRDVDLMELKRLQERLFEYNHPNIVKVLAYSFIRTGFDRYTLYIALEKCCPLFAFREQFKTFLEWQCVGWLYFFVGDIISAIEFLHHNNVAHTDISMSNIVCSSSGVFKLTDLLSIALNGEPPTKYAHAGYHDEEADENLSSTQIDIRYFIRLIFDLLFENPKAESVGQYGFLQELCDKRNQILEILVLKKILIKCFESIPDLIARTKWPESLFIGKGNGVYYSNGSRMTVYPPEHFMEPEIDVFKSWFIIRDSTLKGNFWDSDVIKAMLFLAIILTAFRIAVVVGWPYLFHSIIRYNYGVYTGEVRVGRRHGFGTLEYFNGSVYSGYWQNDHKNGTGKLRSSHFVYQGTFMNDLINGTCNMTLFTGNEFGLPPGNYSGEVQGVIQGQGIFWFDDGTIYDGSWFNNLQHGNGSQSRNGSRYTGNFSRGLPHGYGEFWNATGDYYTGNWKEGKMHEKGIYTFGSTCLSVLNDWYAYDLVCSANYTGIATNFTMDVTVTTLCTIYDGDMFMGKKEGKGAITYAGDGGYTGEWVNDQFHGTGVRVWSNGDVYYGYFVNGYQTKGALLYHGSGYYRGEFNDNVPSGKGYRKYEDGESYEGDFSHNQILGNGVFRYKNGDAYHGSFENGKPHGSGTMYYVNNDTFVGGWVRGQKDGRGVLKLESGATFDETWRKGTKINSYLATVRLFEIVDKDNVHRGLVTGEDLLSFIEKEFGYKITPLIKDQYIDSSKPAINFVSDHQNGSTIWDEQEKDTKVVSRFNCTECDGTKSKCSELLVEHDELSRTLSILKEKPDEGNDNDNCQYWGETGGRWCRGIKVFGKCSDWEPNRGWKTDHDCVRRRDLANEERRSRNQAKRNLIVQHESTLQGLHYSITAMGC